MSEVKKEYAMIIGGQSVKGDGDSFAVLNPATEQPVTYCPQASIKQLDHAVLAAQDAFEQWRHSDDSERRKLLNAIADGIEQRIDELAKVITEEQGKPLPLAQFEVQGAIAWTRAAAALELPIKVIEDAPNKRIELHYKPLGVVGSITPWNWPLMIAAWHIMPAIRAGNSVICKPSPLTPLNTLLLGEIINKIAPAGLVNIVTGKSELGRGMSQHEGIAKIVFTGSTPTGQDIMRNAAGNLKHLTLELGGNDAGIVLPDADIAAIAEPIFQGAFLNMGQTCASLKRLYVHDSQYDDLCERLTAIAKQQVVGNGLEENVTFGPIQNRAQFNKVVELVEDAKAHGAKILVGGEPLDRKGYFYPPTIVSEISDGTRLVDEEQFGPVLPVIRYHDVEEVLKRSNANHSGLGGSVWSADPDAASKIAARMECGTVWINGHAEVLPNTPFGGCKMSGFGVEFGIEGLLEYTNPQIININK